MSTVFPDDPGAPGGQPQPPSIGQPPQQQPQQPQPGAPQPPQQPSLSQSRQQRMQSYQNLITNFTFSLGSGLLESARTQGGPRNRTMAGVGAALMAPQYLQEAQQKYKMQQLQMQEAQQKLTTGALVPMLDPGTGKPVTGPDGQPLMIPQSQAGTLYQRGQAANTKAKEDADREAAKQAELDRKRKDALAKQGLAEDGTPLSQEQMSPVLQQKLKDSKIADDLRTAQTDTATTQAALNRARASGIPDEIALKQKQYDLAVQRQAATEDIARQNLGLRAQEVEIKKTAAENNTPQAKLAAGLYKDATAAGVSYASLQGLVDQTRKNPESASVNDNAMLDQFYNIVKPDKGGRFTIAERTGIRSVGTLEERAKVWGQQLGDRGSFTDQTRQEILDAAKIVLDAKRGASTQQKPQPGPNAAPASGRPVYKLNPATGMPELVNK